MKTPWQIVQRFSRKTGITDPKIDTMLRQQDECEAIVREMMPSKAYHIGIDLGYAQWPETLFFFDSSAGTHTTTTASDASDWGDVRERINRARRDFAKEYKTRVMGDWVTDCFERGFNSEQWRPHKQQERFWKHEWDVKLWPDENIIDAEWRFADDDEEKPEPPKALPSSFSG